MMKKLEDTRVKSNNFVYDSKGKKEKVAFIITKIVGLLRKENASTQLTSVDEEDARVHLPEEIKE